MDSITYNVSQVNMHSFLQDLFGLNGKITLIYNKTQAHQEFDNYEDQFNCQSNNVEEKKNGEFIGSPLKIDLSGSNDINVKSGAKDVEIWTKTERKYLPLNVNTARMLINQLVENGKAGFVFAICDAKDFNKTMFIGMEISESDFFPTRFLVKYCGMHGEQSELLAFDHMYSRHRENCGFKSVSDLELVTTYSIQGYRSYNDQNIGDSDKNCALIDVFWKTATFDIFQAEIAQIDLFLQVNCGSKASIFHPFWETLQAIEKIMNVLQHDFNELDKFEICGDPLSYDDMKNSIFDLLEQSNKKSYMAKPKQIKWVSFNTTDMRNEDFLDKLWSILSKSPDATALRDNFNCLFGEMLENNNKPYFSANKIVGTIGEILQGLIDGCIVIPTIAPAFAIELLIELGMNKLYNDYMYMIENLHEDAKSALGLQLGALFEANESAAVRRTTMSRMRCTTLMKDSQSVRNMSVLRKVLNHLVKLHLSVEFMHLAHTCGFSEATFNRICTTICVDSNLEKAFNAITHAPLVDVKCRKLNVDTSYFFKLEVVSRNVKLLSLEGDSSATTVFHISQLPIMPDELYGHLDKFSIKDQQMFYVAEGLMLKD